MRDTFNPTLFQKEFEEKHSRKPNATEQLDNLLGITPGTSNINKDDINKNNLSNRDNVDFSQFLPKQSNRANASKSSTLYFDKTINLLTDIKNALFDIHALNKASMLANNSYIKHLEYKDTRSDDEQVVRNASELMDLVGKKTNEGMVEYHKMMPSLLGDLTDTVSTEIKKAYRYHFFNNEKSLEGVMLGKIDRTSNQFNLPGRALKAYMTPAENILNRNAQLDPQSLQVVFLSSIYEVVRFFALDFKASREEISTNKLVEDVAGNMMIKAGEKFIFNIRQALATVFSPIMPLIGSLNVALTGMKLIGSGVSSIYDIFTKDTKHQDKVTDKYTNKKKPEVITAEAISKLPNILEAQRVIQVNMLEVLQNTFAVQSQLLTSLTGTYYTYNETQKSAKDSRTYVEELGEFLSDTEYKEYQSKKRSAVRKDLGRSFGAFFSSNKKLDNRTDEVLNRIQSGNRVSQSNILTDLVGNISNVGKQQNINGVSISEAGTGEGSVFAKIANYLDLLVVETLNTNKLLSSILFKIQQPSIFSDTNALDYLESSSDDFDINETLKKINSNSEVFSYESIDIHETLKKINANLEFYLSTIHDTFESHSTKIFENTKSFFNSGVDRIVDAINSLKSSGDSIVPSPPIVSEESINSNFIDFIVDNGGGRGHKRKKPKKETPVPPPVPIVSVAASTGGPIQTGQTVLVGEQGPEIITLSGGSGQVQTAAISYDLLTGFNKKVIDILKSISENISKLNSPDNFINALDSSVLGRYAHEELTVDTNERLEAIRNRKSDVVDRPIVIQQLASEEKDPEKKKKGLFGRIWDAIPKSALLGLGLMLLPQIGEFLRGIANFLFGKERVDAFAEKIGSYIPGFIQEMFSSSGFFGKLAMVTGAFLVAGPILKGIAFGLAAGIASAALKLVGWLGVKLLKDLPIWIGKKTWSKILSPVFSKLSGFIGRTVNVAKRLMLNVFNRAWLFLEPIAKNIKNAVLKKAIAGLNLVGRTLTVINGLLIQGFNRVKNLVLDKSFFIINKIWVDRIRDTVVGRALQTVGGLFSRAFSGISGLISRLLPSSMSTWVSQSSGTFLKTLARRSFRLFGAAFGFIFDGVFGAIEGAKEGGLIGGITGFFKAALTSTGYTGNAIKYGLAGLTVGGPVGMVIGALVGVGVQWIFDNWDKITEGLSGAWEWVKGKFSEFGGWLKDTITAPFTWFFNETTVGKTLVEVGETLGNVFRGVTGFFTSIGVETGKFFSKDNQILAFISDAWNSIVESIIGVFEAIKNKASTFITSIPLIGGFLKDDEVKLEERNQELVQLQQQQQQLKEEVELARKRESERVAALDWKGRIAEHVTTNADKTLISEYEDRQRQLERTQQTVANLEERIEGRRQFGGEVLPNRLYLAGENGIEVFIDKSGKILEYIGANGPELFKTKEPGDIYPVKFIKETASSMRTVLDDTASTATSFVKDRVEKIPTIEDISSSVRTNIVDPLASGYNTSLDYLQPKFGAFGEFLTDGYNAASGYTRETVLPTVQSGYNAASDYTRENVLPTVQSGYNAASDYTRETVVPALQTGLEDIQHTYIPRIQHEFGTFSEFLTSQNVGDKLREGYNSTGEFASQFLNNTAQQFGDGKDLERFVNNVIRGKIGTGQSGFNLDRILQQASDVTSDVGSSVSGTIGGLLNKSKSTARKDNENKLVERLKNELPMIIAPVGQNTYFIQFMDNTRYVVNSTKMPKAYQAAKKLLTENEEVFKDNLSVSGMSPKEIRQLVTDIETKAKKEETEDKGILGDLTMEDIKEGILSVPEKLKELSMFALDGLDQALNSDTMQETFATAQQLLSELAGKFGNTKGLKKEMNAKLVYGIPGSGSTYYGGRTFNGSSWGRDRSLPSDGAWERGTAAIERGTAAIERGYNRTRDFIEERTGGSGGSVRPVTSPLSGKKSETMKMVYDSFIDAGFSDAQSKALTSQVGRENDFRINTLFGTHSDAANAKTNIGFFSWQGSRRKALIGFLQERGLWNGSGMVHGQETLNAMAQFARMEMESGQYPGIEPFLHNPNIDKQSASEILGNKYIKWARGDHHRISRTNPNYNWREHLAKEYGYYDQIGEIVSNAPSSVAPSPSSNETTTASSGIPDFSAMERDLRSGALHPTASTVGIGTVSDVVDLADPRAMAAGYGQSDTSGDETIVGVNDHEKIDYSIEQYNKDLGTVRISSKFGPRNSPTAGASSYHKGVDFAGKKGTPIRMPRIFNEGVVEKAGVGTGYGNVIYLRHPGGLTTRYAHLSAFKVKKGQRVDSNTVIGLLGSTGVSTGPHLHFEVRDSSGKALDPAIYFKTRQASGGVNPNYPTIVDPSMDDGYGNSSGSYGASSGSYSGASGELLDGYSGGIVSPEEMFAFAHKTAAAIQSGGIGALAGGSSSSSSGSYGGTSGGLLDGYSGGIVSPEEMFAFAHKTAAAIHSGGIGALAGGSSDSGYSSDTSSSSSGATDVSITEASKPSVATQTPIVFSDDPKRKEAEQILANPKSTENERINAADIIADLNYQDSITPVTSTPDLAFNFDELEADLASTNRLYASNNLDVMQPIGDDFNSVESAVKPNRRQRRERPTTSGRSIQDKLIGNVSVESDNNRTVGRRRRERRKSTPRDWGAIINEHADMVPRAVIGKGISLALGLKGVAALGPGAALMPRRTATDEQMRLLAEEYALSPEELELITGRPPEESTMYADNIVFESMERDSITPATSTPDLAFNFDELGADLASTNRLYASNNLDVMQPIGDDSNSSRRTSAQKRRQSRERQRSSPGRTSISSISSNLDTDTLLDKAGETGIRTIIGKGVSLALGLKGVAALGPGAALVPRSTATDEQMRLLREKYARSPEELDEFYELYGFRENATPGSSLEKLLAAEKHTLSSEEVAGLREESVPSVSSLSADDIDFEAMERDLKSGALHATASTVGVGTMSDVVDLANPDAMAAGYGQDSGTNVWETVKENGDIAIRAAIGKGVALAAGLKGVAALGPGAALFPRRTATDEQQRLHMEKYALSPGELDVYRENVSSVSSLSADDIDFEAMERDLKSGALHATASTVGVGTMSDVVDLANPDAMAAGYGQTDAIAERINRNNDFALSILRNPNATEDQRLVAAEVINNINAVNNKSNLQKTTSASSTPPKTTETKSSEPASKSPTTSASSTPQSAPTQSSSPSTSTQQPAVQRQPKVREPTIDIDGKRYKVSDLVGTKFEGLAQGDILEFQKQGFLGNLFGQGQNPLDSLLNQGQDGLSNLLGQGQSTLGGLLNQGQFKLNNMMNMGQSKLMEPLNNILGSNSKLSGFANNLFNQGRGAVNNLFGQGRNGLNNIFGQGRSGLNNAFSSIGNITDGLMGSLGGKSGDIFGSIGKMGGDVFNSAKSGFGNLFGGKSKGGLSTALSSSENSELDRRTKEVASSGESKSTTLNPPQTQFDTPSMMSSFTESNSETDIAKTDYMGKTVAQKSPYNINPADQGTSRHDMSVPNPTNPASSSVIDDKSSMNLDPMCDAIIDNLFSLMSPSLMTGLKAQSNSILDVNYATDTSFV